MPRQYLLPRLMETNPNRLWQTADVVQVVNWRAGPDTPAGCSYLLDTEDDEVGSEDVTVRAACVVFDAVRCLLATHKLLSHRAHL